MIKLKDNTIYIIAVILVILVLFFTKVIFPTVLPFTILFQDTTINFENGNPQIASILLNNEPNFFTDARINVEGFTTSSSSTQCSSLDPHSLITCDAVTGCSGSACSTCAPTGYCQGTPADVLSCACQTAGWDAFDYMNLQGCGNVCYRINTVEVEDYSIKVQGREIWAWDNIDGVTVGTPTQTENFAEEFNSVCESAILCEQGGGSGGSSTDTGYSCTSTSDCNNNCISDSCEVTGESCTSNNDCRSDLFCFDSSCRIPDNTACSEECTFPVEFSSSHSGSNTMTIAQSVSTTAVLETCSDGIQNQDETGIDCGGTSCESCDSDGDGINDDFDLCPNTPEGESVDTDGCSESQKDSDGDGLTDDVDQCPNEYAITSNGCPGNPDDSIVFWEVDAGQCISNTCDNCTPDGVVTFSTQQECRDSITVPIEEDSLWDRLKKSLIEKWYVWLLLLIVLFLLLRDTKLGRKVKSKFRRRKRR